MVKTLQMLVTGSRVPDRVGRPTSETVRYRQAEHNSHELIKQCHARVASLEAKTTLQANRLSTQAQELATQTERFNMQSNLIQRLMLENKILKRDLNLLARL